MLLTNWRVRISFSVLIYGNEVCPLSDPYLPTQEGRERGGRERRNIYEPYLLIYTSGDIEWAEDRSKQNEAREGDRDVWMDRTAGREVRQMSDD